MNKIEKCARLMGYTIAERKPDFNYYHLDADTVGTFNPLTNKSDLMGLECELSNICVIMNHSMCIVTADKEDGSGWEWEGTADYADHPDKFTARAHAVVAVAVQIYDRREG